MLNKSKRWLEYVLKLRLELSIFLILLVYTNLRNFPFLVMFLTVEYTCMIDNYIPFDFAECQVTCLGEVKNNTI